MNGLQVDYQNQVTFISLNAKDGGQGEQLFQNLNLPGHPSIVIYTPENSEVFRQFGLVDESILIDVIDKIIAIKR